MARGEDKYIELVHEQINELNESFTSIALEVCQRLKISLDIFVTSFCGEIWDEEMQIDSQIVGLALMCFYFSPLTASARPEADAALISKVFASAIEIMKRGDLFPYDISEMLLLFDTLCVDQANKLGKLSEPEFRAAAHASGVIPNTLKALIDKDTGSLEASLHVIALTELILATIKRREDDEELHKSAEKEKEE